MVPTSVMLNWEVECKKWCPAFKLLTYYGTAKERKAKRQGWSKPNAFHICITSYTLVLQARCSSVSILRQYVSLLEVAFLNVIRATCGPSSDPNCMPALLTSVVVPVPERRVGSAGRKDVQAEEVEVSHPG